MKANYAAKKETDNETTETSDDDSKPSNDVVCIAMLMSVYTTLYPQKIYNCLWYCQYINVNLFIWFVLIYLMSYIDMDQRQI